MGNRCGDILLVCMCVHVCAQNLMKTKARSPAPSSVAAQGSLTLYEPMWQCNMAMLLAALACKWRSPRLLAASASTIAVDQMMWYIDVLGYILTRKWPVGAAAYLSWPETPFVKKLTAWHHIWFLPLCISLLRGLGSFSSATFAASCALNLVGIAASHALVPCALVDPRSGVETYMNINLGHECWKDVKFPMFHWFDRAPMYKIVPWVELNWNALNIPPFLLLKLLAR